MVVDAAAAFAPAEPPRVAVAGDGSIAAIHEPSRVTLLELPSGAPFVEIGVDPEALASDVAWVGSPPRLLVLARYAAHSTGHLIDPYGPITLAEIRLEAPVQLFATVGASALVVGVPGAAVLTATETHLLTYPLPTRVVPLAGGAAATQFLLALAASVEEWDPQSRTPRRRFRLPRAAAITAVGGSERLLWMTTQQEPARIDVIPLVNRGQPRAHDLPEPIERIASHPRSDLLVCIGADSGRLPIVALDGRATEAPVQVAMSDGGETAPPEPAARVEDVEPSAPPIEDIDPPAPSVKLDDVEPPPAPRVRVPGVEPAPVEPRLGVKLGRATTLPQPTTVSERFSAWREQVRQSQRRADPLHAAGDARPAADPPAVPIETRREGRSHPNSESEGRTDGNAQLVPAGPHAPGEASSWRDEVVAWRRALASGVDAGAPEVAAIDAVIARFELAAHVQPAIVLLYAAHLCGEAGAAPVDVARVLGGWDEALGRGELAQRGIAEHARSRVALAAPIVRMLDDLPPRHGTLVGAPGPLVLLGPCVVVAGVDEPVVAIAERCLPQVGGAILVARDGVDRAALALEARAHSAVPMLRVTELDAAGGEPVIFVVDESLAERCGLPRLA